MDAQRLNIKVARGIGGNSRMIRRKDMEYGRSLVETDTRGNTCRVTVTGMEYTDILVEVYTMENGNKITNMVMDI